MTAISEGDATFANLGKQQLAQLHISTCVPLCGMLSSPGGALLMSAVDSEWPCAWGQAEASMGPRLF